MFSAGWSNMPPGYASAQQGEDLVRDQLGFGDGDQMAGALRLDEAARPMGTGGGGVGGREPVAHRPVQRAGPAAREHGERHRVEHERMPLQEAQAAHHMGALRTYRRR